jgi:SpoVK/Ycf46/Vps4 family AAA+-type ATPase
MTDEIINETLEIVKSGTTAVHLCGDDYARIDEFANHLAGELGYEILEWNFGYGLVKFETKRKQNETETNLEEFLNSLCNPNFGNKKLAFLKNARFVLDGETNLKNLARLQQSLIAIKTTKQKTLVVYCDEKQYIPDELSSLVHFADLKPPSFEDLLRIAGDYADKNGLELPEETRKGLASLCKGMSEDSFTQILIRAALEKENFAARIMGIAGKIKKQAVDKSRLLRLIEPQDGMDDIGGLRHLKWWLEEKKNAIFHPEEAKVHGVNPAKGILLAGIPGCGKSLSAKAIAREFNLPLLNLDLGTLMGKYLGQSEEQLRRALRLAENASPCVLWVDEIEKAFAGLSGDESGVTQRLLGYLLTWLNDKTSTVFVVATANDINILPPEFLRRGRFDETFWVDFPSEEDRKAIFGIHLKKAMGREPDFDLTELAKKTEGYAGSDIAYLVNSAMETAWNRPGAAESMSEILETQRKYIKPLEEVMGEKIRKAREKVGEYKLTSASFEEQSYNADSAPNSPVEKRREIAADPRCPKTCLLQLADDPDQEVLLALTGNRECPADVIIRMIDCPFDAVKAKAQERFFETEAGFMKHAREGTKEQKLAVMENIEKIGIDKRDEILCALAEDDDGEVRKAVMEYPYLPEKAWVNILKKAFSDSEALEIIYHPKFPKEAIDTILARDSPYSNDIFIAALSTDYAVKKLIAIGFKKFGDYSNFVQRSMLPSHFNEKEASTIDLSRIYAMRYFTKITDIFKRAYNN